MFCKRCGYGLGDPDLFCARCGAPTGNPLSAAVDLSQSVPAPSLDQGDSFVWSGEVEPPAYYSVVRVAGVMVLSLGVYAAVWGMRQWAYVDKARGNPNSDVGKGLFIAFTLGRLLKRLKEVVAAAGGTLRLSPGWLWTLFLLCGLMKWAPGTWQLLGFGTAAVVGFIQGRLNEVVRLSRSKRVEPRWSRGEWLSIAIGWVLVALFAFANS